MLPDKKIKAILKKQQLAPKKRFGQNFLIDKNISAKIVRLARFSPKTQSLNLVLASEP